MELAGSSKKKSSSERMGFFVSEICSREWYYVKNFLKIDENINDCIKKDCNQHGVVLHYIRRHIGAEKWLEANIDD